MLLRELLLSNFASHVRGVIVLYNLEDKTMVLYPIPRPSDIIRRGLVHKTSLIKAMEP